MYNFNYLSKFKVEIPDRFICELMTMQFKTNRILKFWLLYNRPTITRKSTQAENYDIERSPKSGISSRIKYNPSTLDFVTRMCKSASLTFLFHHPVYKCYVVA